MLRDFDVIDLPDGGYQLVSGGAMFRVAFNEHGDKAMFDMLLENRNKSSKSIFRAMVKTFSQPSVLKFFGILKSAGIIVFDSNETLSSGHFFDRSEAIDHSIEENAKRPIVVLTTSQLGSLMKGYKIFSSAKFANLQKISENELDGLFAEAEFIIVENGAHNPALMGIINKKLLQRKIPWLLVPGVYSSAGIIGPMFSGDDTGCYNCFHQRLRSNAADLPAFDRYDEWLTNTAHFGREAHAGSGAFLQHLASLVAMETECFLLNNGLPQTYGYMLSVDPYNYRIEPHRLYKVPFCEICNDNFEYRRAPWMDSVTLGAK